MISSKRYWIIGILIILLGLFLRLYHLTDRPLHHDESLHAYYSVVFEKEGEYRYNPMLHGPFLFYSNALVYRLFGISDFTARFLPVVFGIALICLILRLNPYLGDKGALAAGFMMAISPGFVYFSRFLRNDIYIATYSVGILYSVLRFRDTRKYGYLYIASGLLALSFCTKENTYFLAFSFISFGLIYWFLLHKEKKDYLSAILELIKKDWKPLLTTFFIFWIIYLPFYTVFFKYPEDWNGFATGLRYWYQQHQIQRIGAPWWYYLPFFGLYEFLPLIISLFYVVNEILFRPVIVYFHGGSRSIVPIEIEKNWDPFTSFLLYWFLSGFILYSYAGEKVPWLMIHMVLPLIILSGWYIGKKLDEKKYGIIIFVIPLVLLTLNATCLANFRYPALDAVRDKDEIHAEMIAYVQTTYDIPRMVDEIKSLYQAKSDKSNFSVLVSGESVWPLAWYLREIPHVYFLEEKNLGNQGADIIITDLDDFELDNELFGDIYDYQYHQLRSWWPPPSLDKNTGLLTAVKSLFKKATPTQLIRYFFFRETYSPIDSAKIVMWTKR